MGSRPITIHALRGKVSALVMEWDAYKADMRHALDALIIAADALIVTPDTDRPSDDQQA